MLLFEGIAAVVAKVASASTVAQATAGLGIAVAGVTGAGAAGILPAAVQDGVASTVEAVTPFDLPHSVDDRISGIDDRHETRSEDDSVAEDPSTLPTLPVGTPSTAAPTSAHVEHGTEIELEDHGADGLEDGTHQHRGGRTPAATPTTSGGGSDDSAVPTPEVEDHHGDDDSGHGGGDDSDDDSGSDDSSGHGGGDDD
jgi:hypothetical protein